MCFSPQRRAIFRHQNFQKCSEPDVFCTFSLQNAFFATATYNFETSELSKALRTWRVLYIFTSNCAFRQPRAIFDFSLTTWLRARRINKATVGLTRHRNHWKNTAFRDVSNIWRGWIFFLLTFALLRLLSSDLLHLICFSSAFQLSILPEEYYLNFLRSVSGYIQIMCYTRSIKSTSRNTSFCWVKVKTLWCAHRHLKTCAEFKLDGHSVDFHFVINDFFMCLWLHLIWQDIPRENQARWTYQKQLT